MEKSKRRLVPALQEVSVRWGDQPRSVPLCSSRSRQRGVLEAEGRSFQSGLVEEKGVSKEAPWSSRDN